MIKPATIFLGLTLLLSGVVIASEKGQAARGTVTAEGTQPPGARDIGITIDDLLHQIDLWYAAVLEGSDGLAGQHESVIMQTVRDDLERSKAAVRELAKRTTLAKGRPHGGFDVLMDTFQSDQDQTFRHTLSIVRNKEQKSLALERTEAVSNKYRLISDYVDLLRKQLGMQRIKLASRTSSLAGCPGMRTIK